MIGAFSFSGVRSSTVIEEYRFARSYHAKCVFDAHCCPAILVVLCCVVLIHELWSVDEQEGIGDSHIHSIPKEVMVDRRTPAVKATGEFNADLG